ncbi:hypothetical protein HDV06_001064 [Boothiomyces sp. JEL0866]|nr:hypothetical protein HDV06_001064 [Boothiomyces sp. JEL0866]
MIQLPPEIQFKIINYLPFPDVCFLSLVSKHYHSLLSIFKKCWVLREKDGIRAYYSTLVKYNITDKAEHLRAFANSGYVLQYIEMDGFYFSQLYPDLPKAQRIVVHDREGVVRWNNIDDSSLDRISELVINGNSSIELVPLLPKFENLKRLRVEGNFPEKKAVDFVNTLTLTSIQDLYLYLVDDLTDYGELFASVVPKTKLQLLSLQSCYIEDGFAVQLAKVIGETKLRRLFVTQNRTSSAFMLYLIKNKDSMLTQVEFDDGILFHEHYQYWLNYLPDLKIERLVFLQEQYEDNLIDSIHESNLLYLQIAVPIRNIADLMTEIKDSKLQTLEFSLENIEQGSTISDLATSLNETTLKEIIFGRGMTSQSAALVVKSLTKSSLQSLSFRKVDGDLKEIFSQLKNTRLTRFAIHTGQLNDTDLTEIANGVNDSNLEYLDLHGEQTFPHYWVHFIKNIKQSKVKVLVLKQIYDKSCMRQIRSILGDYSTLRVKFWV